MADRKQAIKGLKEIAEYMGGRAAFTKVSMYAKQFDDWYRATEDALTLLKEQEAVVRCKDCKYWHDSIRCRMDSEGLETNDNWFCADGERR